MPTSGATSGPKLMGLSTDKIVDGVEHGLAACGAKSLNNHHLNGELYEAKFVPAFMRRLGITDAKHVPARSTICTVYQSHLAQKQEEKTNAGGETYKQKTYI